MKTELSAEERRIIVGAATDLAEIIAGGNSWGYGFAFEKMRYEDATRGLVRPNAEKWFGEGLDPAGRMRWSRTLARLERRGLIERVSAGYDGERTTHVSLTDAGRAMVDKIRLEAVSDG